MVTLGHVPYPGISPGEVKTFIVDQRGTDTLRILCMGFVQAQWRTLNASARSGVRDHCSRSWNNVGVLILRIDRHLNNCCVNIYLFTCTTRFASYRLYLTVTASRPRERKRRRAIDIALVSTTVVFLHAALRFVRRAFVARTVPVNDHRIAVVALATVVDRRRFNQQPRYAHARSGWWTRACALTFVQSNTTPSKAVPMRVRFESMPKSVTLSPVSAGPILPVHASTQIKLLSVTGPSTPHGSVLL